MGNGSTSLGRRRVLKLAAMGGLVAVAPFRGAQAQDPVTLTTAISIGQLALGAARMFQRSSVSNTDEILVRMLANISRQLQVVQDGISTVIAKLDEVHKLVGQIPSAVVQELSAANLRGCIHGYGELLRTRAAYADNRKFLKSHEEEVRQLIANIRTSRNTLINYTNQLNVPVLAAALHIEYGCMRLIREDDERIAPVALTYQDYFRRALYEEGGLTGIIAELRKQRSDIIAGATKPRHEVMRVLNWGHGFWESNVGFSQLDVDPVSELPEPVRQLVALGLIDAREVHVGAKSSYAVRWPGRFSSTCNEITGYGAHPGGCRSIGAEPTRADALKRIEADRNKVIANVNQTTDRLHVAVSNYHAGVRALNFAQQFS